MKRVLMIVAWTAVIAGTGCRHHAGAVGPGMNARREAALFERAAPALNCDPSQMVAAFEESVEANYHVYRVDGCGGRYHALLHCTGICNWRDAPDNQAAIDLQCPATQLTRSYANHIFTISGCGRTASYELARGHITPVTAPAP